MAGVPVPAATTTGELVWLVVSSWSVLPAASQGAQMPEAPAETWLFVLAWSVLTAALQCAQALPGGETPEAPAQWP